MANKFNTYTIKLKKITLFSKITQKMKVSLKFQKTITKGIPMQKTHKTT